MTIQTRQSSNDDRPLNFVRPVFKKFFDFEQSDSLTLLSKASHFGGFFKGTRLFGGHTAAQSFLAAKRLRNGKQPYRIDVNFFAPGTLHHDLIYQQNPTTKDTDSEFASIDVYQNSVLLANSSVRFYEDSNFIEQQLFHQHAQFPSNILEPAAYRKVLDLVNELHLNEWLIKHGSSFNYKGSTDENHIFLLRPIDYLHFAGLSDQQKPMEVWARLSPVLLDLPIQDPEAILILLTDFIIGSPIFTLYDQQRIRVTNSATLNHKIFFHELDFDPKGYFFLQMDLHQANTTALIHGRIFDEKRRLLVTFVQNHYYTLHKNDIPSKL